MELGQPLPVWRWAVVSGETQLLNSNSKTGVQDPRHTWIQNIEKISFQLKFVHKRFLIRFLPAATKLGQGNIFTGACLSTGGVCLSACWDIPPGPDPPGRHPTPQDQTPWEQTPTHPLEQTPPQTRPPGADTLPHPSRPDPPPEQTPHLQTRPPQEQIPPGKQTPAYGQRAAGTHPTGLHSCSVRFPSEVSRGTTECSWNCTSRRKTKFFA